MAKQNIDIEVKVDNEFLGTLSISSEIPDKISYKFEDSNFKEIENSDIYAKLYSTKNDNSSLISVNANFSNIQDDSKLNDYSPIQRCSLPSFSSKIFLLEETDYTFRFSKNGKLKKDIEVFPYLTNLNVQDINFYHINSNPWIFNVNFRGYVGKLFIDIGCDDLLFSVLVEVRSKKLNYNDEYSEMIADLSKISSGWLFNKNAPLFQPHDLTRDTKNTLYPDFMLLEYLFRPQNLPSAYEYIIRNLYSLLDNTVELIPTNFASNIGTWEMAELSCNPQDIYETTEVYSIFNEGEDKHYVPLKIKEIAYEDNIDVPENRFFKFFLEYIRDLIEELYGHVSDKDSIKYDLDFFRNSINQMLSSNILQKISNLDYIPLNSQVLQKKEGYRDIFEYYMMFESNMKINFEDLTGKFRGFQKKLSDTYETWCFFQLIDVINDLTNSKYDFKDFVEFKNNQWSLSLIKGKKSQLKYGNVFKIGNDEVKFILMYNGTFKGSYTHTEYSSYSLDLNPDYTLIFEWDDVKKYIHFDAKYKVVDSSFKKEDIYKMHTYKDAINDSIGAYVLYPGDKNTIFKETDGSFGSVGAFCLKPGNAKNCKTEIKDNLIELIRDWIKFNING